MTLILKDEELDEQEIPIEEYKKDAIRNADNIIIVRTHTFDIIKDRSTGIRQNNIAITLLPTYIK